MNSFVKTLYTSSILLIFLSFLPHQLRATPTISLSLDKDTIGVNKIFALELTASWEGDADRYLIAPPKITLPEGIEEKSSSFSTTSKEGHYLLHYKYDLLAQKEGEYVLKPTEISYWEKGNNKEEKVKTEPLPFKVTSFSTAYLGRYWLLGVLLIILLGLLSGLAVIYKKKKERSHDKRSDATVTREMITNELDQCNAYKIEGDWGNYLKKLISIRNKLPIRDKTKKIMEDLDTLAERVTYGGFRPTTEEINLIQRQLEKALKSAFPNDGDNDLDGIKLQ